MTATQQRRCLFPSRRHSTGGRIRSERGLALAFLIGLTAVAHAGTAPVVTQQPESIMVPIAGALRLTCVVTGTEPISVVWQKDGAFVGAQTSMTLVLSNAQPSDSGHYRLVASNDDGLARSDAAQVIVYTNQTCNFPWVWAYVHTITNSEGFSHDGAASDVAFDRDGNVFVTGEDDRDYLALKFDSGGRVLWSARYSGPIPFQSSDAATALTLDAGGNCYVTGVSQQTNSIPEFTGTEDYWTIKYDTDGNEVWTAGFNSSDNRAPENNWGIDHAYKIAVDSMGCAYVAGTTGVVKLDTNGYALWTNSCPGESLKLAKDESFAYIVSSHGCGLVKLAATNRARIWTAPLPSTDSFWNKLAVDDAGSAYLTSTSDYNLGVGTRGDIEMVKFDGAGNRVWTAVYDGPANGLDYPVALAVGADGSSFVTGYTWTLSRAQQGGGDQAGFDILTLKYGADGGLLWARTYGRAGLYDIASGIAVDAEGNAYVCGTIEVTNSPDSDREGIVIKYDPGGNELWTSQYGSRGVDDVYFTKLTLGPAGKLAVCGWTRVHRGGESRLAFFVLCYDQRTPRLAIGGVPAPGVRQGCLVSPRGSRFEIQATTDFLDWHDLGSVTNWNGVTPFYDRNAGQYPARFYRAQEQKP